jgi:hypothetical protein
VQEKEEQLRGNSVKLVVVSLFVIIRLENSKHAGFGGRKF